MANEIITLNRETILAATPEKYSDASIVKWNSYWKNTNDVHDGKIPVSLLNDPVYCSMNLPSESMCDYTKQTSRDNAHMIGNTSSSEAAKCVAIGAIYKTSGAKLPSNFNIYLGKIDLFAYSKSKESWILLDSQPYPTGAMIYTIPWVGTSAYSCKSVIYGIDYMKINLKAEELDMNMEVDSSTGKKKAVGKTLHFWGNKQLIDKEDYIYYGCAYDFWTDSSVAGKLTATNGIDVKKATSTTTVVQLYSSRGYSSTTTKKTSWGQTVPNSEYLNVSANVMSQLHQNGKTGDSICIKKESVREVVVSYLDKLKKQVSDNTERYSLSRESHGMGKVDWSEHLITESKVIELIDIMISEQGDTEGEAKY